MNRRGFLKAIGLGALFPAAAVATKIEDSVKGNQPIREGMVIRTNGHVTVQNCHFEMTSDSGPAIEIDQFDASK